MGAGKGGDRQSGSHLFAAPTNHALIISSGGIEALKEGSCSMHAMTSPFAAQGVMNLSSLDDNHRELINWLCCNELIELASAFQGGRITLDSLGNPMDECPDTSRDKAAWDFVQTNG